MIEWAKEWLKGTKEDRLELAKKDTSMRVYRNNPYWSANSTFMCNICRETFKKEAPKAIGGDYYTSRYYCFRCVAEIGLTW